MRELSKLKSHRNGDEEVWVKHYSSNHQILLVGEGDFSFSCSLASSFGSASNICASSLDSYDDVVRKYKKARSNLEALKRLGASLLHGVDATKLRLHPDLNVRRFDRVIFNFPHAGFHGKETDSSVIRKHRELVFRFFDGARHMIRVNGEIHVSHKNNAPFYEWNLEELASSCSLVLYQRVAFEKSDYGGYENKRGDGSRCDKPFPLGDCSTFKFIFSCVAMELYTDKMKRKESKEPESKCPQGFSNNKKTISFDLGHHPKEQLLEGSRRFNGVSSEIHKGKVRRMLTRRSFHHPCTEVSPKPVFQRSNSFNGVSHGIYNGKIQRMLMRTSFKSESQEQSLSRQSNLNIHPPHYWITLMETK